MRSGSHIRLSSVVFDPERQRYGFRVNFSSPHLCGRSLLGSSSKAPNHLCTGYTPLLVSLPDYFVSVNDPFTRLINRAVKTFIMEEGSSLIARLTSFLFVDKGTCSSSLFSPQEVWLTRQFFPPSDFFQLVSAVDFFLFFSNASTVRPFPFV